MAKAKKKVAKAKKSKAGKKTVKKAAKKAAKKVSRRPAMKAKSKGKKAGGAFMKPMQVDEVLSAVVGKGPMPRTEITKKLWGYIRKHDLQDKKNKRNINSDENLMKVFGGKKTVSMFEMTKLVSKHLS